MTREEAIEIVDLLRKGQVTFIEDYRCYTGEIMGRQYYYLSYKKCFVYESVELHGNGADSRNWTEYDDEAILQELQKLEYSKVRGSTREMKPY